MKKTQPIRMCITCRARHPQNTLIRFKHEDKEIVVFNGEGRSIYLCQSCSTNEKKVKGLVKRFKQDEEYFTRLLKGLTSIVSSCD